MLSVFVGISPDQAFISDNQRLNCLFVSGFGTRASPLAYVGNGVLKAVAEFQVSDLVESVLETIAP